MLSCGLAFMGFLKTLTAKPAPAGIAKPRPWYHWFEESDTPAECKLLLKLNLLICVFAFACYWVKNLDYSNVSNAYVSGMATDLHFKGNDLIQFQTMSMVGAAIFQLPCIWLLPKLPINFFLPFCDICWGLVTLFQYKVTMYGGMMACRFLVGVFEAPFFIGVHWCLGSWYRKDEINRCGALFYLGLQVGSMSAGFLQAATITHLGGRLGLAPWQWMYIINASITLPISLAGFFLWHTRQVLLAIPDEGGGRACERPTPAIRPLDRPHTHHHEHVQKGIQQLEDLYPHHMGRALLEPESIPLLIHSVATVDLPDAPRPRQQPQRDTARI